ncbi:MAG: flagellar hook-associated protein FlgK [Oscillospiraceae bacterium]|jgi:flagellar hook-associated protein 1 FlgK
MASTFGGLETAKSGLVAARTSIDVTGHNIANANTVGYTRQRVLTSAREPGQGTYLISQFYNKRVGQGVDILEIQQLRSSYLDQQYRILNGDYMYSDKRVQSLTYLEGLFNELDEESGLTTSIENFYSALNVFSSDTSSLEYRTNVQQQALGMIHNFNVVYDEMKDLWHNQNDSISVAANRINAIAKELKYLNEAIASYERSGQPANDLRDERNLLLDELSGLVNITYAVNSDNPSMIDVKIGGLSLVSGSTFNQIEINSLSSRIEEINGFAKDIADLNKKLLDDSLTDPERTALQDEIQEKINQFKTAFDKYGITTAENPQNSMLTDVSFNGVLLVSGSNVCDTVDTLIQFNRNYLTLYGNELSIEAKTVTGGQLYSHMEMITGEEANSPGIPYYMKQLNLLAQDIARTINEVHKTGWTYPYGGNESTDNINFFYVPSDGGMENYDLITAGNFALDGKILESAYNIAGSAKKVDLSSGSTETGNNEVARRLLNTINDGNFFGKLNSIVGHLAIEIDSSRSILDTRESLINSVDKQRMSISGVDLDEEATNLIVFQQTYAACARVVTAIDEMLSIMINNMGRVGL